RHARLQPADAVVGVASALLLRIDGRRYPQLDVAWKICLTRQHADDRSRQAVQAERLADHVRRTPEPLAPLLLADHDHARPAWLVLFRREDASKQRLDAQHLRQVVGHGRAANTLRPALA